MKEKEHSVRQVFVSRTLKCTAGIFLNFCFLLILSLYFSSLIKASSLRFERLGVAQGLPQNSITTIFKSSDGRLWVGTQNGLSWYDGYQFQTFESNANNPFSISDNYIWSIAEDKQGFLWIGTRNGGLNRFDPSTNHFKAYQYNPTDPLSIGSNNVTDILIDSRDRMWVATGGAGLHRFDRKNESFISYIHNPLDSQSIAGDFVKTLTEGKNGSLWIGLSTAPILTTEGNGLDWFDPVTEEFKHFSADGDSENRLTSNEVSALYYENEDSLWVGTYLGGLNHLNPNTGEVTHFRTYEPVISGFSLDRVTAISPADKEGIWVGYVNGGLAYFNKHSKKFSLHMSEPSEQTSLSNKDVVSLLQTENNLWVGTWWAGLNKLILNSRNFHWVKHDYAQKVTLPNAPIRSFAEDSTGNIWLAARNEGLICWNIQKNKFQQYLTLPNTTEDWSQHLISSVMIDSKQNIWVGTSRNGLYKLNKNLTSYQHYTKGLAIDNQLVDNNVNAIIEYPEGVIWVASRGGGISKLTLSNNLASHYTQQDTKGYQITSNTISSNSVFKDSKGYLWFGTEGAGVMRLDVYTNQIIKFSKQSKIHPISHNVVSAISEDLNGNIWLATYGGGLNKLSAEGNDWKTESFDIENSALPSNAIDGLVIDNDGIFWISMVGHLSRLNPKNNIFRNYNRYEGALPGEYFSGSSFKNSQGSIFFGGNSGMVHFSPEKVRKIDKAPQIMLTNFSLFNQVVDIQNDKHDILNKVISKMPEIVLNHQQNVFSFSFTTLDYLEPEKNQYAYQMIGFNTDWIYTDANNRQATYTNLDAGDYIFKVIASDRNGHWNRLGRTMPVKILPAPWETWWAYLLYVLTIISVISIIIYQKYCYSIAQEKRRVAEKSNEAKSNFLAVMSHEIRNPINGVVGSVGLLSECDLNEEQSIYANTIKTSGESLLYIVNDILDLSKIEAGDLTLENHCFNLRHCLENALDIFSREIDEKKIELIFIAENKVPLEVVSDSTRLRQIIVNLVGNAIKFTENGFVMLRLSLIQSDEERIHFSVKDSGVGISEAQQKYIFDAFRQADSSIPRKFGGTGLGLTISQKLISILGGNIKVNSIVGKGTEFNFSLAMKPAHNTKSINSISDISPLADKTIVFVECDFQIRQVIFNLNETLQSKLKFFDNIPELMDYLSNHPDPDLIVKNHVDDFTSEDLILQLTQSERTSVKTLLLISPKALHSNRKKWHSLYHEEVIKPLKIRMMAKSISRLIGLQKSVAELCLSSSDFTQNFSQKYPLNILLAEDNAVNQKVLLHTFRKLGYNPDIVSDGSEVLEAIKLKEYNLLLTDIQMPNLNGIEASKKIRHLYPDNQIMIVLCSAENVKKYQIWIDGNIIQGILLKPIELTELKRCLAKSYEGLVKRQRK